MIQLTIVWPWTMLPWLNFSILTVNTLTFLSLKVISKALISTYKGQFLKHVKRIKSCHKVEYFITWSGYSILSLKQLLTLLLPFWLYFSFTLFISLTLHLCVLVLFIVQIINSLTWLLVMNLSQWTHLSEVRVTTKFCDFYIFGFT